MHKYSNYITSLALILQVIFLTATIVRLHQFITLAIGVPESEAPAGHYMDSELFIISIDASQNMYITFSSKKDMRKIAGNHITYYNNSTVRMSDHNELSGLLRASKEQLRHTRIMIAANKALPGYTIMQLFSTLRGADLYKYQLLTKW